MVCLDKKKKKKKKKNSLEADVHKKISVWVICPVLGYAKAH